MTFLRFLVQAFFRLARAAVAGLAVGLAGVAAGLAVAAPIIMMSQNRQSDIDRKKAENDYNVNIKAELEIELLHQKVDELREKQLEALTQAVADLTEHVKNERQLADAAAATAAAKAAPKAMAAAAAKPAATTAKTAKPATAARASRKKA